jgi:hypothetical protein
MKHRFLMLLILIGMGMGLLLPQAPTFAATVTYTTCPTWATLEADADTAGIITFNIAGTCTVVFSNGIIIDEDVEIINIGGDVLFDGNGVFHFDIESGASLVLDGIEVFGGTDSAIYVYDAYLLVQNSVFYDNVGEDGGAIYADFATVEIIGSTFDTNQADDYGGAIYSYEGDLVITDSHFENNQAANDYGGAIYTEFSSLVVDGSTFEGNYANNDSGGAIGGYVTLALITASSFYDNYAAFGGAIELDESFTFIGYSSFYNNEAESGGAIYNYDDSFMLITNSTFHGNRATVEGGAIVNDVSDLGLLHVTIANNSAPLGANIVDYSYGILISATIIANGDCHVDGGLLTDNGYNIQFNAAGCVGTITDPMLGAFTGGYMIPATGSPAIDAIPTVDCVSPDDQIGTARPQGAGCDIGAIEGGGGFVAPVPTGPQVIGCVFDTPSGMSLSNLPDNTYCTVLMRNGSIINYPGAVPAELIGLGVVYAVDVYRLEGGRSIVEFPDYGRVCLRGDGRMFYMDARNAPRYPIEMPTEEYDGMTCAWIPAAGTLILTN